MTEDRARPSRRDFLKQGAVALAGASTIPTGVSFLTSCGGGSSSNGPLQFWQFYSPGGPDKKQDQWFQKLVGEWNKNNKVQIKLTYIQDYVNGSKLQTAFASGKGPDIFLISPGDFTRYSNGGVLVDLSQYMSKQAIGDYFPSVIQTRQVNGKIYGLPMEVEPMAFYYSVDAFEKAGLNETDVPKTWPQLLDLARRLKKPNQFGLSLETIPGYYQNFTWYPFLWQTGNYVVKSDGKTSGMASAGAADALALWQQAVQEGSATRKPQGTGGNDTVANLASGYAAMMNVGIWGVAQLRDGAPKFRYGVFSLPLPPGGAPTTVLGGWAFVANAKGANPEAAAKFCVWAMGSMDQSCIERGYEWVGVAKSDIAPRQSVLQLAQSRGVYSSGAMQVFKDQIFPTGHGEPRFPPQVYKPVSDAIQAAELSGANPKDAATKAAHSIQQFLSSYHGVPVSDEALAHSGA